MASRTFAYADSYDESAKRNIDCDRLHSLGADIPDGLVVRSDVALSQLKSESATPDPEVPGDPAPTAGGSDPAGGQGLFVLISFTALAMQSPA